MVDKVILLEDRPKRRAYLLRYRVQFKVVNEVIKHNLHKKVSLCLPVTKFGMSHY